MNDKKYTVNDIKVLPVPKSWPEFFSTVRKRPTMYIYSESSIHLAAYIAGIQYIESITSKVLSGFDFAEFENWVALNYNLKQLTFNSFTLASHFESEPKKSFALWFSWYDKFEHQAHNKSLNKDATKVAPIS